MHLLTRVCSNWQGNSVKSYENEVGVWLPIMMFICRCGIEQCQVSRCQSPGEKTGSNTTAWPTQVWWRVLIHIALFDEEFSDMSL